MGGFVPGEVGDVYETLDTFLKLGEYTEVGDVADNSCVLASYRVFLTDRLPRVREELFDTEAHLLLLTVEGKDLGFNLVTYFEEVLGDAETWAPAHLRNVDKTLNTRLNLYECAIVSDENDLT